jgi:ATP-dependent DNA helicase RecG
MKMVSLLPEESLKALDNRFGIRFRELSVDKQLALVTVENERKVTHARLMSMTTTHSRDISLALAALVREGFLESDGMGRGTFYFFSGEPPSLDDHSTDVGYELDLQTESDPIPINSDHLPVKSDHLRVSSDHLPVKSDHLDSLVALAQPVYGKRKVSKELMQDVICALCRDQFLTQKQLSEVLDRSPHTLRNSYLTQMIKDGQLELKYPNKPNHPQQAYRTKSNIPPSP